MVRLRRDVTRRRIAVDPKGAREYFVGVPEDDEMTRLDSGCDRGNSRFTLKKANGRRQMIGPGLRAPGKEVPVKIASEFLFALVIGACPLAAQYARVPPMQGSFGTAGMEGAHTMVAVPPAVNHCPVSMRAQHLSDGSLVKTGKTQHPAGIGQRLHLTLKNPESKQIRSAELTIHGVTAKGRVMDALSSKGDSSDATQNMSVRFLTESDGSATADVWVPGVTAVQSIALDSAVYSDGSTWKAADGMACRVTPDPLMLISGR